MALVFLIDGETGIVDASGNSVPVTVNGGTASVSTTYQKYGTSSVNSGNITGTAIYTETVSPDPIAVAVNTGAYTFEGHIFFTAVPSGTRDLINYNSVSTGKGISLQCNTNNASSAHKNFCAHVVDMGSGITNTSDATFNINEWNHWAIVVASGVLSFYANGTRIGQLTGADVPASVGTGSGESDINVASRGIYFDELAFSSTAKYTGTTYTVPTSLTPAPPEPSHAYITLPAMGSSAFGGASGSATLPKLQAYIASGGSAAVSAPKLRATLTAHNSTGEQAADITLPSLSVVITTGAYSEFSLPSLSLGASMTVTNIAAAPITLPGLSVGSDATVSGMADAAITLPSMSASAYSGALCSVTIGSLTVQATGTTGSVASAQVTLPLMQATAQATANGYGSAAITLPSLSVGSSSRAALTLPGLKLTAIGTATITATYEAYAVNLNHADPNASDETTRYTNFPFTHVVRYKNSYYGANSTGLYLLEGTTDDGAAIPFDVKTAMTDFKSPIRKTVASAYFSGRFGPASTITLTAGEGTPVAYSFSTPRGQAAQNHRQVFGKGLKDRYFALEVAGTGTLELDGIEMDVAKLSRRI